MSSLLVPMEPAIILVRDVIRKWIAETTLMKTTAVSNMYETCSGVLKLVYTGQLCTPLLKSAQRIHVGRLKSAMMGVFTSWKLANTTSQGLFVPGELVVKHLLAYYYIISISF